METLPERFALTKNPAISKVTNKVTSSRYQNHESWQQGRREKNVSLRETWSSEPFVSASCPFQGARNSTPVHIFNMVIFFTSKWLAYW